jgi:hypothetical protein
MYERPGLELARERQRTLLAEAAARRIGRQVRAANRIARRAQRLQRLEMRRRDQVARLRPSSSNSSHSASRNIREPGKFAALH